MATFHEIETPDASEPWDGPGLPPAVGRIARAAGGMVAVVALTYLVPGAERFQPWAPGDEAPFAGMFRLEGSGPVVAEAGGHLGGSDGLAEAERAALAATALLADAPAAEPTPGTKATVAGTEGSPGGTPEASGGPAAGEPAAETAEGQAGEPTLGEPEGEARPEIEEALYKGLPASIEDPNGVMAPFYRALERTARKEPGAVTRIAHWGDSAIGADGMTSMSRRLLQTQLGDAGHGWILVASGSTWYKHKDIRYQSSDSWKAQKIIDQGAKDGRYGMGGVAARGYLGAKARFGTVDEGPVGTRVSRFEVHYLQGPKLGRFSVSVDGEEPQEIDTSGDTQDKMHVIEVPDGPHELRIRAKGGGPVRLYGVVLERDGPGVVYDSFGLVGARGSRLLNADPEHWKTQLEQRSPDLMILMYGGNDLADKRIPMETYKETFRSMVKRFRTSRPEAACLVMSPLDHGERYRGRVRTVPRLISMMEVQREVALAEGCAWYSVFDAMGGDGAMGRWFKATPKLGWGDLAHVTAQGARVIGTYFFQALMEGFAAHLEEPRP